MIRAMIFDLDGTLVQTERLKALSYARATVELCPYTLSEAEAVEAFKDVVGLPRREVAQALVERFDPTTLTAVVQRMVAAWTATVVNENKTEEQTEGECRHRTTQAAGRRAGGRIRGIGDGGGAGPRQHSDLCRAPHRPIVA
jgi:phosphoglycolate phosphatase-like HAD superfamily hydrolase